MASIARVLHSPSLAALMHAATTSEDAQGVFYVVAIGRVQRFLQRHFPDAPDEVVEDWASDTLALVLPKLHTCRAMTDDGVIAWLFTAASRIALTDIRSHADSGWFNAAPERCARSWRTSIARTSDSAPLDDAAANDVPDDSASASLGTRTHDDLPISMVVAVTAVSAQRVLPAQTQEILYRRIIEGEAWKTLARLLGTTPSGCKRRFQRAQSRLRRQTIIDLDALPEPTRTRALAWTEGRRAS